MLKELIEKYEPVNEQETEDKKMMIKFIEENEDYLTRDNKIAHFSASNWIVNKERTKVLMIFHNIYNSWAWTGGHADGDEDLLHVARKEAKEETGVNNLKLLSDGIASLEILTVNGHVKRGKYVSSHLHFNCTFIFEADENESIRIKADENKDVKWIEIDKVNDAVSEWWMKPTYQKLIEKTKTL
jgi:ADP-ribose pyrophosphatase YjhB (NUDIX family)